RENDIAPYSRLPNTVGDGFELLQVVWIDRLRPTLAFADRDDDRAVVPLREGKEVALAVEPVPSQRVARREEECTEGGHPCVVLQPQHREDYRDRAVFAVMSEKPGRLVLPVRLGRSRRQEEL